MSRPVLVGIVLTVLALGGLAAWFLSQDRAQDDAPIATAEAKQYVRNLALTDFEMKATESYLAQRIVEITGMIANNGPRKLRLIEVTCIFYDPMKREVKRERVAIVRPRSGGLAPQESKPYRLAFDTLPANWNQAQPQIVVANIEFE